MVTTDRLYLLLIFIRILSHVYCSKMYKVLSISEPNLIDHDPTAFTNISWWANKYSEEYSSVGFHAVLLEPVDYNNFMTVMELYRVAGSKKILLPLKVAGDGCTLLKSNAYFVPDLKRCGMPKQCPIEKGTVIHIDNLTFRQENFPNFLPNGVFYIKIDAIRNGKPILVVSAVVKLATSKTAPPMGTCDEDSA